MNRQSDSIICSAKRAYNNSSYHLNLVYSKIQKDKTLLKKTELFDTKNLTKVTNDYNMVFITNVMKSDNFIKTKLHQIIYKHFTCEQKYIE